MDYTGELIVGTWTFTEEMDYDEDGEIDWSMTSVMEFKANGTCINTMTMTETEDGETVTNTDVQNATYKIKGNKLTLIFTETNPDTGKTESMTIENTLVFSNNNNTVTITSTYDGETNVSTMTRVIA